MTHCIPFSYCCFSVFIFIFIFLYILWAKKMSSEFWVIIASKNICKHIHSSYSSLSFFCSSPSLSSEFCEQILWHRPMMNSFPTHNSTDDNNFLLKVKQNKWFLVHKQQINCRTNVLQRIHCSHFFSPKINKINDLL